MDYRIYKDQDFRKSNWTGGTTTQLAIFPEDSKYLERNFIWRLSSATCDQEETTFSRLPDYDRVLMVLEGNTVLAHQDVRVARLSELEQDRFDGGYVTKSFGKITDYNLMVAKGCQGFLDVIVPGETNQKLEGESFPEYECRTEALFCKEGYAAVTIGKDTQMLTPGQQLVVNCSGSEKADLSVMGEGTLIRAQIFYNDLRDEMMPTVIPAEKATFDDFKTCIFLSNSQFRGAKFVFKRMKQQWYDEELSGAIRKVERLYLPFFITVIGACIVLGIGFGRFEGPLQWVLAMGGWFLADFLLISPLIYFAVVPKPTRKHIKDIDHLTPYEAAVRERELGTNEQLEKLMKKYRKSGRVIHYDENGNGIDEDF